MVVSTPYLPVSSKNNKWWLFIIITTVHMDEDEMKRAREADRLHELSNKMQ